MGSLGFMMRRKITISAHTKAQPTEPTPRRWALSRMVRRPKRPLRSTARAGKIGISQTRTFIVRALPSSQTTPETLARRSTRASRSRSYVLKRRPPARLRRRRAEGPSPFQEVHVVEIERGFPPVEGNHEGQTNRCFRGSNRNDKERKYLTTEIL